MPLETDAPLKNPLRQKKERKFADPVLECYVTFFARLSSCSLCMGARRGCVYKARNRANDRRHLPSSLPAAVGRVAMGSGYFLFISVGRLALPWRCTQHDAIFIAVLTHFFFSKCSRSPFLPEEFLFLQHCWHCWEHCLDEICTIWQQTLLT